MSYNWFIFIVVIRIQEKPRLESDSNVSQILSYDNKSGK